MRVLLDPGLEALTEKIIGAAFAVSTALGHGFLETVYKNAFVEELTVRGLHAITEKAYPIYYREKLVGKYVSDLVVEDSVIVELKAVEGLSRAHRAQVLNYLKASRRPVGLLFNFGRSSPEMKRILLGPVATPQNPL